MDPYYHIHQPTLILNEERARTNIRNMMEKAAVNKVRLRPHFKTHQSAVIGEWFREEGVQTITVSSLAMAKYFADHGWEDITVAFPFNLREIEDLWALGSRCHLELLVESLKVVEFLGNRYGRELDLWIKVDAGGGRTGIPSEDFESAIRLAEKIVESDHLKFKGILSHFGQTYHATSREQAAQLYSEGVARMQTLRTVLRKSGFRKTKISVGDTPGCCASETFGGVDEIRPGNFVFFDITQLRIGSCSEKEIAVAVACPVVSKHPERQEVILYGGAVQLSKDFMEDKGVISYGDISLPSAGGWKEKIPGAYIRALSQEHGIVHLPAKAMNHIQVGDLLMVLPVHSCLTVAALGEYLTLEGERIGTMVSRSGDETEGHGGESEQEENDTDYPDPPPVFR